MKMRARDFRRQAREALKGKWVLAILVALIAGILGGTICTALSAYTGAASGTATQQEPPESIQTLIPEIESLPDSVSTALGLAVVGIAGFTLLAVVVRLLIGGAVSFGYATFNMNLVDGREAKVGDLFSKMHIGKGFLMNLLMGLYVALWTLLLVIPGIIKAYSYAMTPYILAENPMLTVNEAITKSRKLMNGNKWRLFCLQLSFIGWDLLAAITLGIADLWINPYKECANAAFYRQICAEKEDDWF